MIAGHDPRQPASERAPGPAALSAPSAPRALLAALLVLGGLGGCCLVRPPHARELVDVGLRRTPEQAFRGFQAALAADLSDEEFKSFSGGFRRANRMTLPTYMEAKRRLLEEQPWVFKGVAEATIHSSEVVDELHHLLRFSRYGREIEVALVREDFWEMWAGDQLLADGWIEFGRAVRSPAPERLRAEVALEAGSRVDLAQVTELRIGQEWKIDAIRPVEGPTP
jgi:hypothetical protein